MSKTISKYVNLEKVLAFIWSIFSLADKVEDLENPFIIDKSFEKNRSSIFWEHWTFT